MHTNHDYFTEMIIFCMKFGTYTLNHIGTQISH